MADFFFWSRLSLDERDYGATILFPYSLTGSSISIITADTPCRLRRASRHAGLRFFDCVLRDKIRFDGPSQRTVASYKLVMKAPWWMNGAMHGTEIDICDRELAFDSSDNRSVVDNVCCFDSLELDLSRPLPHHCRCHWRWRRDMTNISYPTSFLVAGVVLISWIFTANPPHIVRQSLHRSITAQNSPGWLKHLNNPTPGHWWQRLPLAGYCIVLLGDLFSRHLSIGNDVANAPRTTHRSIPWQ